jgi:hypothetical protein
MGQADLLAFLKPGATSRQEAIEKLGHPNAEYEHGRIQTFWIAADEGGYRSGFIEVGTTHQFSLVLVFDEKDLLVRHALVRVRGR